MSSSNKNIICKQLVELQFSKNADAFVLQENANAWCLEQLVPAIVKKMERFSSVEDIIRFDKISVVIDDKSMMLDGGLADKIVSEIEQVIEAQLAGSMEQSSVVTITKEKSYLQALVFFLEKGYLPWWSNTKYSNTFYEQFEQLKSGNTNIEDVALLKSILTKVNVIRRLATADDRLLETVLYIITGKIHKASENLGFIYTLASLINREGEKRSFMIEAKSIMLENVLTDDSISFDEKNVKKLIFLLVNNYGGNVDDIIAFLEKEKIATVILNEKSPFLYEAIKKIKADQHFPNAETQKPANEKSADNIAGLKDHLQDASTSQEETDNEMYINNAGLIILAPFIERLFANIGIAENGAVNSKDLGVAMLHFLATGREEYAEFELVLPKILCGMVPSENIMIIEKIPPTFIREANELLLSVITHWDVLKDTSAEALQVSFLLRLGKLSFKKDAWLLQVEQKPYDMLLQQLPWSIGLIKLPWMQHLIKTEWIY